MAEHEGCSHGFGVVCLLSAGDPKPGDPRPKGIGYLEVSVWADVQCEAGLVDVRCAGGCGTFRFPQELSDRVIVCFPLAGRTMQPVRIEEPVCLECAAAGKGLARGSAELEAREREARAHAHESLERLRDRVAEKQKRRRRSR